jgi:[acyl-carrier-protein] S-malonyltransferase
MSQPAILTVSVAVARTLQEAGVFPDAVAGHSVGEFAALVASEAVSFEDSLRAVTVRAEAMARAGRSRPGAMAAILGLPAGEVERICRGFSRAAGIAAINGPAQIVVSGESDAVDGVAAAARTAGARRVVRLDVSVAAHSRLMEPAVGELRRALTETMISPPRVPFTSCVSARPADDPSEIVDLLCGALTRPVRWVEVVRALTGNGATRFYEVGPGRVLAGLMRAIVPEADVTPVGDDDAVAALTGGLVGRPSL